VEKLRYIQLRKLIVSIKNEMYTQLLRNNIAVKPNKVNSFVWRTIPDITTSNALIRLSSKGGVYSTQSAGFTVVK